MHSFQARLLAKSIWIRVSNETGQCNFSGHRFLHCPGTKGQRDKLKILPRDGTGRDSQNPGRDGPGQPKTGTGRGTKRDRAEKDVLKQYKDVLKQKKAPTNHSRAFPRPWLRHSACYASLPLLTSPATQPWLRQKGGSGVKNILNHQISVFRPLSLYLLQLLNHTFHTYV